MNPVRLVNFVYRFLICEKQAQTILVYTNNKGV